MPCHLFYRTGKFHGAHRRRATASSGKKHRTPATGHTAHDIQDLPASCEILKEKIRRYHYSSREYHKVKNLILPKSGCAMLSTMPLHRLTRCWRRNAAGRQMQNG